MERGPIRMKVTITYLKPMYDAPDTERTITLPFELDEDEEMVTFKMTEEGLYDLISVLNASSTSMARIRP